MEAVLVIGFTSAIFLAMILQLAGKPSITSKVTGTLLVITSIGGLCLYGYGFSQLYEDKALAVIRTLWAVIGMFMGRNEVSSLTGLPLFQNPLFVVLLWLMHVFAIYTLASAAITTVGANALKALRLMLARTGNLTLIYGTNADSISFGRQCNEEKKMSVVFVSGSADGGSVNAIQAMGASLRTDEAALHPTPAFLRSIGIRPGKRKIQVYCLDHDEDKGAQFAIELLKAMETAGIDPSQTSLTLPGEEEILPLDLQASAEKYGYGFVNAFRLADQAARLMIAKCPPWEAISFREDGCAAQDFEALIIGFGQVGQSVLRYLTMNGQFAGSHYRAAVMTKDLDSQCGYLKFSEPGLFDHYDIDFIQADARSTEVFKWIAEHHTSLRYIAVCVANEAMSREITRDLMRFTDKLNISPVIVQCSYFGIRHQKSLKEPMQQWSLFSRETLDSQLRDHRAVILNHTYNLSAGRTAWEDWLCCDYFGRMSSRASADFMPAMLKAAGTTAEEIAHSGFHPTEKQLENLGQTEHLRWCAFHYCFGFSPMTPEEFDSRAAAYIREREETGKGKTRIGKNMISRTHACLIPWEELDELSRRENAITGGSVDYKKMDIQNVESIPEMLKEYA